MMELREVVKALQEYLASLPAESTPRTVRRYLEGLEPDNGGMQ
jgi:hypothetical protein